MTDLGISSNDRSSKKIGVDLGNVLIKNLEKRVVEELIHRFDIENKNLWNVDSIESLEVQQFLKKHSQPVQNCQTVMKWFIQHYGRENIYIITKVPTQGRVINFLLLSIHNFFTQCNVRPDNVLYVEQSKQKAIACCELGITIFIDDSVEVLKHMQKIVPKMILFNASAENKARAYHCLQNNLPELAGNWVEVFNTTLFREKQTIHA